MAEKKLTLYNILERVQASAGDKDAELPEALDGLWTVACVDVPGRDGAHAVRKYTDALPEARRYGDFWPVPARSKPKRRRQRVDDVVEDL